MQFAIYATVVVDPYAPQKAMHVQVNKIMEPWKEDESPFLLYLANGIYADNACESCTPFPTSSNP